MGILNLNDDSFSGDGTLDPHAALALARQHIAAGADILDLGAESARTNRPPIPASEEIRRLESFLQLWHALPTSAFVPRDPVQISPPILSVNTWRPEVAAFALQNGCELLNDIGGAPTPDIPALCARARASYLLMHTIGLPKQSHSHITHANILTTLTDFFRQRIPQLLAAGLPPEQLLLDPGLGFAKQPTDDATICANLHILKPFRRPILLPISRKGFLGKILNQPEPRLRDAGTIGAIAATALCGAHIFRVHNVHATWQTLKTLSLFIDWKKTQADDESNASS